MGGKRISSRAASGLAAAIGLALLAGQALAADGVKIGVLSDQSSISSDVGGKGSTAAARMAAQDFGGSVLGQPIEVIDADFQMKPDNASSIATRWYTSEGVDAITDLVKDRFG